MFIRSPMILAPSLAAALSWWCVAGVPSVPSAAQPRASASQTEAPTLKPVDPGVADVGPLSGAGRVLPKDLRQPANFDRVYEVELDGKRYFVRAHGGVYAVFPRSDYVQTRRGVAPIVPAGTVYHLGALPKQKDDAAADAQTFNPASAKPARPMRREQAAPSTAAPNAESAAAQPAPSAKPASAAHAGAQPPLSDAPPPTVRAADEASIWTSDRQRVGRIGEWLDRARAARLAKEAQAVSAYTDPTQSSEPVK
jgi:hypothetical protein